MLARVTLVALLVGIIAARNIPGLLEIVLPSGVHVHFLDPNDAAVSKYARGDVRDREWLRAGLDAGLLSIPVIDSRFRQTTFFDVAESRHARAQLEADEAWLAEGESA